MKKLSFILILFIFSSTGFGQEVGYPGYTSHLEHAKNYYSFPTDGLKLLMDPARIIYDGEFKSNGVVMDFSGNENHGSTVGNLEDDQPADPSGLLLDGISQYIEFPTSLAVWGSNDLILFSWVWMQDYSPGSGNPFIIFDTMDMVSNLDGGSLGIEFDGNILTWGYDLFFTGVWEYSTTTSPFTDGEWACVVQVVNRTGSDFEIYINDVEISLSVTTSITTGNVSPTSTNLFIGNNHGTEYSDGLVGLSGLYLFDGQDGAPSSLPSNYRSIIREIYYWSKNNRDGY